ncbi:Glycine receptor subunit beta-type 4 [Aphelenchoides bicaudatus]|nr:Glycine receptor subunit beta-type 4 [Aphelenchoides bicaudatus]
MFNCDPNGFRRAAKILKRQATVRIGIYIESVGKFHSAEMTFYIYCNWHDPKLRHSSPELKLINDPIILKSIWRPDLYLANSRNSMFHDILLPNFSIFVDSNGNVAYSTRITATITCSFELQDYPMDSQKCYLRIVSYATLNKDVNVIWFADDPLRYRNNIGLPEFSLQGIHHNYCNGTYKYAITESNYKQGAFSCLQANIRLKRSAAYHVIQSYIPSAFIVVISTVSFWLDRRAIHARITLWFTTLLSLYTVSNSVRNNIPEVSCVKALDIWFGSCLLFIFGTLVEAAVVNTYMRKADKFERMAQSLALLAALDSDSKQTPKKSKNRRPQQNQQDPQEPLSIKNLTISYYKDNPQNLQAAPPPRRQELQIGYEYSRSAFNVDQFSRIGFPLVFSVFNLVYWLYFLSK